MDSRAEEVFVLALEKESEERETFLGEACGGDAELRLEVQRMLVDAERAEALFGDAERDTELETARLADEPAVEQPGDQVGLYILEEQLGEGGYGVVWRAEQKRPIARRVAIKIVKAGMDSRQVLARFEAERQALALMDHPHIAKVFDAGTTGQGRPYFAMELILGSRITDYCERNGIDTGERLRLILQACHAIQHAHQKGVVHRDIKPSNVLVAEVEGRPDVKVIDFGIAKAMGISLTERTLMTGTVEMMGTMEYMSPEQFAINSRHVDSRTDVYSLGVLTFKLLTGKLPHEFGDKTIYGAARMVVEEPARRLRATGRMFRGDLDTIVGKALEKEPELRYPSVSEFAADLQRFLDHDPITARRAGTLYRLKLFARRNKVLVAGVTATITALVVGMVLALVAFGEARRERRAAEEQVYRSALMAASRSYETNDAEDAKTHLARVPDHLRDWIWSLLAAQAEEPLLEFRGRGVVFADEGTIRTVTRWGIEDWDVAAGARKLIAEFSEEQPMIGAKFTPDGALVLTNSRKIGDDPYLYRVLDATTGEEVSSFSAESVPATLGSRTVLAVGNRRVVFKPASNSIHTRDLCTGEEFPPISLTADVHALSPDEDLLAISNNGKGLMLYDVRTGKPHQGFEPMDYRPWHVAFNPKGQTIATVEGGQSNLATAIKPELRIWEMATGAPVHAHNLRLPGRTDGLVYDADGTRLAIPVWQDVIIVDAQSLEIVRTLSALPDRAKTVSFSPDGAMIAAVDTTGQDRGSIVHDACHGMVWWSRDPNVLEGHRSMVQSVAISPDGQRIASGAWEGLAGAGGCIRVWDAATGVQVAALGPPWIVDSLHFTPDGSRIVTFGRDFDVKKNRTREISIHTWDADTGRLLSTIAAPVREGTVSQDGRFLAGSLVTGELQGVLVVVDLQTGERREGEPCQLVYRNAEPVFSPDLARIASAAPDHSVIIADAQSLRPLVRCAGHTDEVTTITFRKGGHQLLTASTDDTVRLWNVATGEEIAVLKGPHTDALSAVFSPDDAYILSGGQDGKIRVWSPGDRQVLAELTGHRAAVNSLAISPDGNTIVSGSEDRTVRLWSTKSRRERREAIAQRRRLAEELTPVVARCFEELPDATAVVAKLRSEFEGRRREVALQLALNEAVKRRSGAD